MSNKSKTVKQFETKIINILVSELDFSKEAANDFYDKA